jgi:hypothetical protein
MTQAVGKNFNSDPHSYLTNGPVNQGKAYRMYALRSMNSVCTGQLGEMDDSLKIS